MDATILEVGQNIALHALHTAFPVHSMSLPQIFFTHAVMRDMRTFFVLTVILTLILRFNLKFNVGLS